MLFFSFNRPGGSGGEDIWVATRATEDDNWANPVNLGPEINSSNVDSAPCLSPDGSVLYFMSLRPGGVGSLDLWQVAIVPIIDFNSDGKANGRDAVIMTECWGENEPRCDIGPYAWGDGTVNDRSDIESSRAVGRNGGHDRS